MVPDPLYVNMAKYHFAHGYHEAIRDVQDIAGGALVTGPGAEDLDVAGDRGATTRSTTPATASAARPAEGAWPSSKTSSRRSFGAYQEVLAVHAEGSLEAEKHDGAAQLQPARPAVSFVRRLAGLES